MLTQMRKNVGSWIIKLLLGAIVVVFVLWGVGSNQKSPNATVATVDGTAIGYQEFSRTYQNLLENIRRQFGDNVNEDMLNALNLKEQAINQLVDRRIILNAAEKMGFDVTDEELSASIAAIPAFQSPDGFNTQRYQAVLAQLGLTPETFEASQREDLLIQKMTEFIAHTVNVSEAEAMAWYQWQNATVDIEYLRLDPKAYKDLPVSDEDARTYFDAHQNQYETAPQIKSRYLVFRPADYKSRIQVSDEEVKTYYDENQAEFYTPETVEARHILIKVGKDADEAAVEAARGRAQAIYERAVQGEDFAKLAKEFSEGPSRNQGGYLGTFGRGKMIQPFEDEAFALKAGEISAPVRTDFGWHIIKVEKHNIAHTLTLEEAQNKIRGLLSDQKARALALEDAESAYDMTYGGDDMLAAAESLGVTVHTTDWIAQGDTVPGVADSPKFVAVVFALDTMAVSDVKDLGDGFYLIQALEDRPAEIPPFDTVKERVVQDAREEKQWTQADTEARAMLQSLRDGGTLAALGQPKGLSPKATGEFKRNDAVPGIGYDQGLAAAAFKLSTKTPFPEAPVRGQQSVFVFRLLERRLPDAQAAQAQIEPLKQQLLQRKQGEIYQNWIAQARNRTEIEIDRAMLN